MYVKKKMFDYSSTRAPSTTSSKRDASSYRGRSSNPQHQQYLDRTSEEIVGLQDDLEILSQENIKIRATVEELESHLDAINKALEKNIDTMNEANHQIQEENDILILEIERRNELMDVVRPMLDQCLEMNPEAFEENEDLALLLKQVKGSKSGKSYEVAMDPLLNKILPGLEYFKDCKTNEDFLQRCKIIFHEIQRLENGKVTEPESFEALYQKANCDVLRKHLGEIQSDNNVIQIDYSERIKELSLEKEQLLEERRQLIDAQINKNVQFSTVRRSPLIQKSIKSFVSPINRISNKASFLRF